MKLILIIIFIFIMWHIQDMYYTLEYRFCGKKKKVKCRNWKCKRCDYCSNYIRTVSCSKCEYYHNGCNGYDGICLYDKAET